MTSAQLAKLALEHISKVLEKLTDDQLQDLAAGLAYFEFRSVDIVVKSPRTTKVNAAPAFDVNAVTAEIKALETSEAITNYLNTHKPKFLKDDLVAIAEAIGPTVSPRGTKDVLVRNIAEGVAGFRERAEAVGSWGR